jgi:histidyl-tRNA synthetase
MRLRQKVIGIFRDVFERHGFEPLDTPAIEYLEVLTGKAGENEKLMYQFTDQGNRDVGLRYDLTVPLARVMAMHQNDIVLPFKRYHIAPVWRAERPQRGRGREFWQCDADIVGSPSMLADAESIAVLTEALDAVGLNQATVLINHRRLLESLARLAGVPAERAGGVYRAIDKLSRIGPDGVLKEFEAPGIDRDAGQRVLDLVALAGEPQSLLDEAERRLGGVAGADEAINELRQLLSFLTSLGVSPAAYRVDLSLARGIDYYTGPVYEAVVSEHNIGSVAGAGRYDGLVGTFLGRPVPATGMSLGFERIIEVVRDLDLLPVDAAVAQVFVVVLPATLADAGHIASGLRGHGLRVDQSILINRGLGDQLRHADRRGIPITVIPGEAEMARGSVAVKDLKSGEQREVPILLLAEEIQRMLSALSDTNRPDQE